MFSLFFSKVAIPSPFFSVQLRPLKVKPVEIILSPRRRKEIYKYLAKLCYDLSNTGAYIGPSKLNEIIKFRGINDIGLHTIRKWLQSQDNYSLQKPISKSFKNARAVVNTIRDSKFRGNKIRDEYNKIRDDYNNIRDDNNKIRDNRIRGKS